MFIYCDLSEKKVDFAIVALSTVHKSTVLKDLIRCGHCGHFLVRCPLQPGLMTSKTPVYFKKMCCCCNELSAVFCSCVNCLLLLVDLVNLVGLGALLL